MYIEMAGLQNKRKEDHKLIYNKIYINMLNLSVKEFVILNQVPFSGVLVRVKYNGRWPVVYMISIVLIIISS